MKTIITILTILLCSTATAQLCFIGQPASQVKSFWQKKISPQFITTNVHANSKVPESVWIAKDTSEDAFTFMAYFNNNGKCFRHYTWFKADSLEQNINMLNINKSLKRIDDRWYDYAKNCYYIIEQSDIPKKYMLTCVRR